MRLRSCVTIRSRRHDETGLTDQSPETLGEKGKFWGYLE